MNARSINFHRCRIYAALCMTMLCVAPFSNAADRSMQTSTLNVQIPETANRSSQLALRLNPRELDAIVAKYRPDLLTKRTQLDEVVVSEPAPPLPVHSETRDVWPGIAAPFWALAHPLKAWRILAPIPNE
jgi:hypothetical protein